MPRDSGDDKPGPSWNPLVGGRRGRATSADRRTYVWISGWAVCPAAFHALVAERFPHAEHTVYPPDPDADLAALTANCDRIGGYSLGAFLLLEAAAQRPFPQPTALLAPFFSFLDRDGQPDPRRRVQVRHLTRQLQQEPLEALRGFADHTGLHGLVPPDGLPYAADLLDRGLATLARRRLEPIWPERTIGVIGQNDPVVDVASLAAASNNVLVVTGADHHPVPLLDALAPTWI